MYWVIKVTWFRKHFQAFGPISEYGLFFVNFLQNICYFQILISYVLGCERHMVLKARNGNLVTPIHRLITLNTRSYAQVVLTIRHGPQRPGAPYLLPSYSMKHHCLLSQRAITIPVPGMAGLVSLNTASRTTCKLIRKTRALINILR